MLKQKEQLASAQSTTLGIRQAMIRNLSRTLRLVTSLDNYGRISNSEHSGENRNILDLKGSSLSKALRVSNDRSHILRRPQAPSPGLSFARQCMQRYSVIGIMLRKGCHLKVNVQYASAQQGLANSSDDDDRMEGGG